jgi:branched-chain amino acid transport system permease protein
MESIIPTIVSGIMIGAVYALIAYGISLLMGIMKFLNIAHGSFLVLGGYISFWLFHLWGLDPYLSIPLIIIIMFVLGLAFYRLTLSPLVKLPDLGKRLDNSLLVTFGMIYVLDNIMTVAWSSNIRSITTVYTGETVSAFGLNFSISGLSGLALAILSAVALYFIFSRTYFGKHVRAATQDADASSLCGVNVGRTYLISCGIGIALAGVAGVVVLSSYSISATSGMTWLTMAIVTMVLAGEGRLNTSLPAGVILGVIQAISIFAFGAPYRQAVALVLFIIVLMVRPQGLFSKG